MNFGGILKDLRMQKKMSRQELAKMLELSESAIAKYEEGQRSPDLNTLIKIAKFFDVSTDYLLGLTNIPKPEMDLSPELKQLLAIALRMPEDKLNLLIKLLEGLF
ncbi:helix-turn-helix protein [Caldicellulosiruptor bescii]|uniref:Transcriptional regulator, XRE family n=2 Tax=Caldicellulosiruptor bescii TaxID=31899 RepID=B9MNH3_CALBD|nr:helix-turn-helix transcriptional regulator [Caldicellulosiruptor bescii]ACM61504.1 transcriptional regulator, XRE family [Caldicellulosiruptor bescii DSM 6725]PBC88685.1 helix-turn-helix protein [Caldicellulosiruptor bescii]PBC91834.1 helix-turn-helix protein [Caldicellulosiruptor bescii]PBD02755.1 helix-turn-helix protein [Caldicellulosiruptor bescii]PBD07629.1 helix-turn-helix protein [Caldicellulosiruptor bescii]